MCKAYRVNSVPAFQAFSVETWITPGYVTDTRVRGKKCWRTVNQELHEIFPENLAAY
jgi:hypothetical protein